MGVVSDDKLLELLELAMSSDTAETVKRARELMDSGVDPMVLMSQLASLIMDIIAGTNSINDVKHDSFFGPQNCKCHLLNLDANEVHSISQVEMICGDSINHVINTKMRLLIGNYRYDQVYRSVLIRTMDPDKYNKKNFLNYGSPMVRWDIREMIS